MERSVWTDERVDDAIARIDQRFDAVDRNFDRLFAELGDIRGELVGLHRQFAQAGWALAAAVFVQLVAVIVATAVA
jgi:hypothetical protein